MYAQVEMRSGPARRRRIYLTAPREVAVEMYLEPAHAEIFWNWYENRLSAGNEPFSTQLPHQGSGLRWWWAQFVEPPEYSAMPLGRFRLRARLLLRGTGSVDGPAPTGSLVTLARVPFTGRATVRTTRRLSTVARVAFMVPRPQLTTLALIAFGPSVLPPPSTDRVLREDGGLLLREDGSAIQRE